MKRTKVFFIAVFFLLLSGCTKKSTQKIDIDFTKMDFDTASEVLFDFLIEPEKYENKTVLITGKFNSQIYEGNRYYSAVLWDSDGCPVGIDFIPPENLKYPFDFPQNDGDITVSGVMKNQLMNDEEKLCFIAETIHF